MGIVNPTGDFQPSSLLAAAAVKSDPDQNQPHQETEALRVLIFNLKL